MSDNNNNNNNNNKKPRLEEKQQRSQEEVDNAFLSLLLSSSGIQKELCAHLSLADKIRLSTVTKSLYESMNGNEVLWKEMNFYAEKGGKQVANSELRSLLDRTGSCVEHLSLRGLKRVYGDCGLGPLGNRAKNLKSIDLRIRDHDVRNGSAESAFDVPGVLEILKTIPSLERAKFRWIQGRAEDQNELTDIYEGLILSFVVNIQSKRREKYIGKKCCDKDCKNKTIQAIPQYHDMDLMDCDKCKGTICPKCPARHCRCCNITFCWSCDEGISDFCPAQECFNMFCGDCHSQDTFGSGCSYGICDVVPTCCNKESFLECGECGRNMCGGCYQSTYGCASCDCCDKKFCHVCGEGVSYGRCENCREERAEARA